MSGQLRETEPFVDHPKPTFLLPPDYEPELSLESSFGGMARRLWEDRFRGKEALFADSETVYTGIGGAPGLNAAFGIKKYGDGSYIPTVVDLKREFGRIPKTLFLPASPLFSDHIIGLKGLARTYKEMGVELVVPIMTALAHERQDHLFTASDGQVISQVTTLKDVIETLAGHGYIDAALLLQPHSLRSVELSLRMNFPLLPIDGMKLLMKSAGLESLKRVFVVGPDKGRKDDAKILASILKVPIAAARKVRNRLGNGDPTIELDREVLSYIRSHKSNVIMFDDEIREAGTTLAMAQLLDGHADSITVCAVKAICAQLTDRKTTAVDNLMHPLIKRIVVTDAVHPLNDMAPVRDKLEVIRLDPEIRRLASFLTAYPVAPDDPNWLRDADAVGSLLRLDLSVEHIE